MERNEELIDSVFRRINRAVWVVTAAHAGRRGGLAATWVSQASLDPSSPQIIAGIAVNHFTRELIDGSRAFAAHLLRPDQTAVCLNFAIGSGRDRDKLDGLGHRAGVTGSPLLNDCLARLDCRVFARFEAGERIHYLADVEDGHWGDKSYEGGALTERELIAAATDREKEQLAEGRQRDIQIQAPLHQAWRERID